MSQIRPALTLLVTVTLISRAATASAAQPPSLTPTPPPTFSPPLAADGSGTTTTSDSEAIARTGDDLPRVLLVAGILIGAGSAVRARPLVRRG
jgi:hypothetical protein